jgi:2-polyprenyl-3-methyl-5-hydroxy-6-metoxy-1,4-benzoquinol methylase
MNEFECPVCSSTSNPIAKYQLKHTVYQCNECKLELCHDAVFNTNFNSSLNEKEREKALKQLRKENFQQIAKSINRLLPNAKGLEVGCGYGWFLETCKEYGIQCDGIEPEPRFNNKYLKGGFHVRNGFYPDIINETEQYDFVIFNDVLEHIPGIEETMKSNHRIINNEGLLVINIPIQEGLFYFFSKVAYQLGYHHLLNRMWQFSFHSPHLYYFRKKNIKDIGIKHGFTLIESFQLKTIRFSDISYRIKQDQKQNFIKYSISFIGAMLLFPFTRIFPDTYCFIFQKNN